MNPITDFQLPALTTTQKGFIVSIRSIIQDLRGDALREAVAEIFPPPSPFGKEICDLP